MDIAAHQDELAASLVASICNTRLQSIVYSEIERALATHKNLNDFTHMGMEEIGHALHVTRLFDSYLPG